MKNKYIQSVVIAFWMFYMINVTFSIPIMIWAHNGWNFFLLIPFYIPLVFIKKIDRYFTEIQLKRLKDAIDERDRVIEEIVNRAKIR